MITLKIKFTDFWYGFSATENYFYRLLSSKYNLVLSERPDILIYSCYGRDYLNYKCVRIFYSAENIRPDFNACDYAIGFDYNNDPRHYRLPLYALYIDQPGTHEKLCTQLTTEESLDIWRNKKKFCCMVVSNGGSKKRINFFNTLSQYKPVDSGGKILNNVGGPVVDKMTFIKDYRFVLAFENSSHPGYTTEKIIEPFMADCIPVYWGDPNVTEEFNEKSFLNLKAGMSDEAFIDLIKKIDADEALAAKYLAASKFKNGEIPNAIDKEKILRFWHAIVDSLPAKEPVAKTLKKYLHSVSLMQKSVSYQLNRMKNAFKKYSKKNP